MGVFVMLTTVTDEGSKAIKENPEIIKEMNKEIEAMGVKILSQHAVFGMYDLVNIVEAPDNETMAKVAVEIGSHGTMDTITLPAIPIDDFIAKLKSISA